MPVGFGKTDVEQVAALARLRLTEDEKQLFAEQLGRILQYAAQIRDLDTGGVAATAHVLDRQPSDRPDASRPSLPINEALKNAPEPAAAESLFKVPRVLGG